MLIRRSALSRLIEAAIGPEEAAESGIAIFTHDTGDTTNVVAYDVAKVIDACLTGIEEQGDDPLDAVEKNGTSGIVGLVSMHPAAGWEGKCYGSYVINNTVARKGYGPMIYDLALALGKPVVPDRKSVSKHAQKVWLKYMDGDDVEKFPLDDKDAPKTKDKNDDCLLNPAAPGLDFAYFKSGSKKYSPMFDKDKKALSEYNRLLKTRKMKSISEDDWHESLTMSAADYFTIRYSKDVIYADDK